MNCPQTSYAGCLPVFEGIVSERTILDKKKGGRFAAHLKASDLRTPEPRFTTQIFSWLGIYDRI